MWEFHSFDTGRRQRWSWKHHRHGKLRQESEPRFNTVGEAIADAGFHGFEAHVDRWVICAAEGCYRQPSGARFGRPHRSPARALQAKSHK
jgi:hypothetical protein